MVTKQISLAEALRQWVPDAWIPGIIKLCRPEGMHTHLEGPCKTPGKRPLGKRFNAAALERYARAADPDKPGLAREVAAWRHEAEGWLEDGFNVGLVPPLGVVVLDCDTRAAVLWVESLLADAAVPRQGRTGAKAHFWLRYDPEILPLRAAQLKFHLEGSTPTTDNLLVVDLRVGGRSQAVIAPSTHTSGVNYAWDRLLPDDIRDLPMMPRGLAGVLETLLGLTPGSPPPEARHGSLGTDGTFIPGRLAPRKADDSDAGHDRLRGYVNRLCRYSTSSGPATLAQVDVRARAERFARDLYAGRPDTENRLAVLLREGGELDRLVTTGWGRFGGRSPLVEDRTDQGYLDTLMATWGDRWRWVIERAEWRVWDAAQGLWVRSFDELVAAEIGSLHSVFLEDALREPDEERRKRLLAMAKQMRGSAKVRSVRLRLQAACAVTEDTFDADPWLVACPGGWVGSGWVPPVVLDLGGDELSVRAPRAEDFLTRGMGAPWVPGARSAVWERFLEESAPDVELRDFLARVAGMTAVGETLQHVFLFLYGPGGTGKSTFLGAVAEAFGSYAVKCDFRTFAEDPRRSSSAASPDVARLRGARMAVCSEIPDHTHLGARMKDLTGGDRIVGRHLYGRDVEFRPSHTVWIAGNCEPSAEYLDTGVWRRMRQIPFDCVHAAADVALPIRLSDPRELTGIVGWIVRGWESYRRAGGTGAPAAVEKATAAFRARLDPLAEWLEDCVRFVPGGSVGSSDAWGSFQAWVSRRAGESERITQTRFSLLMKARGVELAKLPGGRNVMIGIEIVGGITSGLVAHRTAVKPKVLV